MPIAKGMMKCVFFLIFCLVSVASAQNAEERKLASTVNLSSGSSFSNPTTANLDADTSNGSEFVVASSDGNIQAFTKDLMPIWSSKTPNAGCGSPSNRVHSSPAVFDLNNDGIEDVVVGYGGPGRNKCDGGTVAFNGRDGTVLWNFGLKAFGKKEKFGSFLYAVFATPVIADTTGKGDIAIAFGSYDRNVYLLNANGTVRWYYNAADTVWSSPAFADINGDGRKDLIVSTDISANKRLKPPTSDGGILYAFDTKTRNGKRIYFREKGGFIWKRELDQVLFSSPVVADLVPSNPGPEIAIASGCFFPQNSSDKRGKWIKIVSAKDGKVLRTIKTQACSSGSVAVGDLYGAGLNAIVHLAPAGSGNSSSTVTAYNPATGEVLWSVVPTGNGRNQADTGSFQTPAIADIDGDGVGDVIVSHSGSVLLFKGNSGERLSCSSLYANGCRAGEIQTGIDLSRNSPFVVDLNGDRRLSVVVSQSGGSGRLQILRDVSSRYHTSPVTNADSNKIWWNGWRAAANRAGAM
jgi:hypothetical protein